MEIDNEMIVDDQGTGQEMAREMLKRFCQEGFDSDIEAAALVLGRPSSELEDVLSGKLHIDDDLALKLKGIAQERGI